MTLRAFTAAAELNAAGNVSISTDLASHNSGDANNSSGGAIQTGKSRATVTTDEFNTAFVGTLLGDGSIDASNVSKPFSNLVF